MTTFLESFYQHLGIEFPSEEQEDNLPMLVIDDTVGVCFAPLEEDHRLQLICVVGPLPRDPNQLVRLLDANYSGDPDIVMAASESSDSLLALAYASELEGFEVLEATLEKLASYVAACRSQLDEESFSTL